MIRLAQMQDLPAILALMVEAGAQSRYVALGGVHRGYAEKWLQGVLFLNGSKTEDGTWVSVAITPDGAVEGFHIGSQQRIGLVGVRFEASDALFYVSPRAPAFSFAGLLHSFFSWAARTPRIAVIRPGATDMLDDPARVATMYERLGFRRSGIILERAIAKVAA